MEQPVPQTLDAALNFAAEQIAQDLLAEIDSALANPALRAMAAAGELDGAAFNAVLRRVTAKFAALARPRRKISPAPG